MDGLVSCRNRHFQFKFRDVSISYSWKGRHVQWCRTDTKMTLSPFRITTSIDLNRIVRTGSLFCFHYTLHFCINCHCLYSLYCFLFRPFHTVFSPLHRPYHVHIASWAILRERTSRVFNRIFEAWIRNPVLERLLSRSPIIELTLIRHDHELSHPGRTPVN